MGILPVSFTLIEYTGPLTYTPGSNTVSAAVNLTQTGNPANTLHGPIVFAKSSTDRFNTLTNQPGVWTNASSQTLSFDNEIFSRDIPTWPTNYVGYVYFADGDPSTASPDYQLWVLSINDTNDANANGIPDFSDNPASVTPPRAPHLSLAPGSTNLLLNDQRRHRPHQPNSANRLPDHDQLANDAVFPANQRSAGGFAVVAVRQPEVLARGGVVSQDSPQISSRFCEDRFPRQEVRPNCNPVTPSAPGILLYRATAMYNSLYAV